MIRFPTVLVIGAGSSIPYGFPSGKALRDTICSPGFDLSIANLHGRSKAIDFVKSFRDSHINSIDAFLSRRPEFVEIGKLAIARIICKAENPYIFQTPIDDDWYSLLWNKIVSDIHSIEDLNKNVIKVVTFNYDRSLEYFLHTSIMNTFNVAYVTAFDALKHIPIVHFYGQLGELSSGYSTNGLPYNHDHDEDFFYKASTGIKIIPETRKDEEVSKTISEWFVKARNIFFLGFGFDNLNIERLGLKETLKNNFVPGQQTLSIMASTYGLTLSESNLAGSLLTGDFKSSIWSSSFGKSTDTLRHFAEKFI